MLIHAKSLEPCQDLSNEDPIAIVVGDDDYFLSLWGNYLMNKWLDEWLSVHEASPTLEDLPD